MQSSGSTTGTGGGRVPEKRILADRRGGGVGHQLTSRPFRGAGPLEVQNFKKVT